MRNRHVTRFGNPATQIGALYNVSDHEGLSQMALELLIIGLHQEDVTITKSLVSQLDDEIRTEQRIINRRIANLGIPDNLLRLFQISKKAELKRYLKKISITEFELFLLIHNCHQINFTHSSKFPQYVPEHLEITDDDHKELENGNPRSISKKMNSILLQRKLIHPHLFQRDLEWHCLYFNYEDIETEDKNHWIHGSHLHYVNYLWPGLEINDIWDAFDTRKTKIPGNLHIRFIPYEFPHPDEAKERISIQNQDLSTIEIIYNLDLVKAMNNEPLPIAQLATRGSWQVNISMKP